MKRLLLILSIILHGLYLFAQEPQQGEFFELHENLTGPHSYIYEAKEYIHLNTGFEYDAQNPDNYFEASIDPSIVVSIIEIDQTNITEQHVKLYPNPVQENLYIQSQCNKGRLLLFDMQGRQVKDIEMFKGATILKVNNLKPGIYFYQYILNNNVVQSGKWIKE